MKIIKSNCSACGAPISIPDGLDYINCSSCGAFLAIERGEGYVALKVAEKLAKAIEESGFGTQEVIRENTQVTRSELQRLQQAQELSAAQMQLSNIQSEIRLVQRGSSNLSSIGQVVTLRKNEYQAMEQIRTLKKQITIPAADDLKGRLEIAEWERDWISGEINALTQSNQPQRFQIIETLNAQKNELNHRILELRVYDLKTRCRSFQINDPPMDDQNQIAALLSTLAIDENWLRSQRSAPEGKVVYQEVIERQQRLKHSWNRLDLERTSGALCSPGFQADPNDLQSLHEYLERIDQDLNTISQSADSGTARDYRKKFLEERKRTLKQIQTLERHPGGVRYDSSFALNPAVTGGVPFSFIPERTHEPANLKSIGSGCFFGFLTFLAGLVFAMVIAILVFGSIPNNPTSSSSSYITGIILFLVTIGFGLGARVFLRRAATTLTIRKNPPCSHDEIETLGFR